MSTSARYDLLKKHIEKLDFVKRPAIHQQLERKLQLEQHSEQLRLQACHVRSHKPKGLARSAINSRRDRLTKPLKNDDDADRIAPESSVTVITAPSSSNGGNRDCPEPSAGFGYASIRLKNIDIVSEDTDTTLRRYWQMREKACRSLDAFFKKIRAKKELGRALLLDQQRIDKETMNERQRFGGEEISGHVNRILAMKDQIRKLTERIDSMMAEACANCKSSNTSSLDQGAHVAQLDEDYIISTHVLATVEHLDPKQEYKANVKGVTLIQRAFRGYRLRSLLRSCEYPLDNELLFMNKHLKELVRSALQEGNEEPGCMPTPPRQPRSSCTFSDSTYGSIGSNPRGKGRGLRVVETDDVDGLFEITPSFNIEGGLKQGSFFGNIVERYEDTFYDSSSYQHQSYSCYYPDEYQEQQNYRKQHYHYKQGFKSNHNQNQLIVRSKMDIHSKPLQQRNYFIDKMKHFHLRKKISPEKQRETDLAAALQNEWGFKSTEVVDHIMRRRGKLQFGVKRCTKKSPKWKR